MTKYERIEGRATKAAVARCCGSRIGGFNAKAQGRKDAKSLFLLCDFATLRLCVEMSFLSPKSPDSESGRFSAFGSGFAALCPLRFSSIVRSVFRPEMKAREAQNEG
ncbi:MAG: hypothetical protein ABSC18_18235 [Verrucomicrobiota bacterium]